MNSQPNSDDIINAANQRQQDLAHKNFDGRSFFNGFVEGAVAYLAAAQEDRNSMLTLIDDMLSVFDGDEDFVVTGERHEAWVEIRKQWIKT